MRARVLFSLILAVGMLVDDAIIVSEFAERRMAEGIPRKEAERLIVFGFFNEVLERIAIEEVRAHVAAAIGLIAAWVLLVVGFFGRGRAGDG